MSGTDVSSIKLVTSIVGSRELPNEEDGESVFTFTSTANTVYSQTGYSIFFPTGLITHSVVRSRSHTHAIETCLEKSSKTQKPSTDHTRRDGLSSTGDASSSASSRHSAAGGV